MIIELLIIGFYREASVVPACCSEAKAGIVSREFVARNGIQVDVLEPDRVHMFIAYTA